MAATQKNPRLIGIMGQAKHGKDTIGDHLISKYGFRKYAFAAPLKKAITHIFRIDRSTLSDPELKERKDDFWNVSPRQIMQFVGTELFRENMHKLIPDVGKDIWIKSFEKWYIEKKKYSEKDLCVVVTDIRFQNEADIIHKMGGVVWKVIRTEGVPVMNELCLVHASEMDQTKITEYDILLYNSGTIEELNEKIDHIMDYIQFKK